MGAHEALNFAQLLGGKATAASNCRVVQPDLGAARALVDMDVWWLVGLMAIEVETKAINAQDGWHFSLVSERERVLTSRTSPSR